MATTAEIGIAEPGEEAPAGEVGIQTGVPDFFCDEGTGQRPVLNPEGCLGTLYTYMDGRNLGSINLLAMEASEGPSAWDSFVNLYNSMERFCSTHPIACSIVPATISLICRVVFGGDQSIGGVKSEEFVEQVRQTRIAA